MLPTSILSRTGCYCQCAAEANEQLPLQDAVFVNHVVQIKSRVWRGSSQRAARDGAVGEVEVLGALGREARRGGRAANPRLWAAQSGTARRGRCNP